MQAIRFHQHGGPEVLRYESAPDPVPGAGEILLRVRACALNHLDLFVRDGIPGVPIPLPHIGGCDIAGQVAELGPGVEAGRNGPAVGDAVILSPGIGCGRCPACDACRENECPRYTVLGYGVDGGYAELVKAPAENALPLPAGLDFAAAAAVPLVFLTAWHMLRTRAELQPGQQVLVWAASSGVGSAAVQIAKWMHCRVIATAGGERKMELAKRLGADEVLDHYRDPIAQRVKALTGGGVDVVFEHVGQATWEQSVRSLANGGTLVTCGATTGPRAAIDLRHLFARQLRLVGSYMGPRSELRELLPFIARGDLHPVVDRTFPLAETAAAQRYLQAKEQFGKVVVTLE